MKVSGDVAGVTPKKYIEANLTAGKPGKNGSRRSPRNSSRAVKAAHRAFCPNSAAKSSKKTGKECTTVPTDLEAINEVSISPLEKGLEIDDI